MIESHLSNLGERVVSAVICSPCIIIIATMYCRQYQSCSYRHVYSHHVISPQLTVQCHRKKTAPRVMYSGSAATDHEFSYFTPLGSNSVYSYQWSTEKWEELPPCPNSNSGLVIINGQLTAVGGRGWWFSTNKLFTFRQRQWIEEYPPMNTARSETTAVSSSDGEYIIVIGGRWTATVELFQVSSRRWHQLKDLPQPLYRPSATLCGNQLHVIGTDGNGYSCSLQALLSSDRPITSQSIPHLISWTSLPRLPVEDSTAATLSGQLVIIGGYVGATVKSIHQLVNRQWVDIGSMPCVRRHCLVVTPSPDKMMIVGGWGSPREKLDIVEECVVV